MSYLQIAMPNVMRLLDEGIAFPRTHCGGPKCSPARWSILTGRNAARNEFAQHRTLQSGDGYWGTNVTIQTSKLLYKILDIIFRINYKIMSNYNIIQEWLKR